nr:uncharacterized protein LOC119165767 [Rhipicephalus microplus]
MRKPFLVAAVILLNVVPLLALPKWLDWLRPPWRRTTTTPRPVPPTTRNYTYWPLERWPWNNRTRIKRSCDGGNDERLMYCLYPAMCNCSRPSTGGYIRLPKNEPRWFYNKTRRKCQPVIGVPGGCNNFDNRLGCRMYCELPRRKPVWLLTNRWW